MRAPADADVRGPLCALVRTLLERGVRVVVIGVWGASYYAAAAASNPDYTLARLNLANLLLQQGNAAEATRAFQEVLTSARAQQDAKLVAAMEDQLRRLRGR